MERINEVLNNYKYPLLLCLVGIVLIFSGSFSSNLLSFNKPVQKDLPKESLTNLDAINIKVDIAGAVNKPGVYSLAKEARVDDLLKIAGGVTASASGEYIAKQINLSQKISDGQKIYIPFKGEDTPITVNTLIGNTKSVAGVSTTAGKININNATQAQLEELPGVGPATAQKIITARPFASLAELTSKKAVGKAVFNKIKDLVEL